MIYSLIFLLHFKFYDLIIIFAYFASSCIYNEPRPEENIKKRNKIECRHNTYICSLIAIFLYIQMFRIQAFP
ncbi:hypothetical protein SAMN04487850_1082 [Prevotella aff. ruminicola Tc2-24]|uniref:Uncharacterized protein n=1 Tax=Prevotella aff. ruminicola Tc2-24 TaxID=81582 RepID=A0A1I0NAC7_9BACT|nr:hypothetical protein SAMN04487828_1253 [Prevotella sp. lc2012]SEV98099.1 hypothetical protein SAMN04487850_1082 [Prevotella aff. ruminicola Tc2-24]